MTAVDPYFTILAALATGGQLAIFLFLYRDNREPFFWWWILAWGFRLAFFLAKLGPAVGGGARLWAFAAATASLGNSFGFLASGLAYRTPAARAHRALAPLAGLGLVLAGLDASPLGRGPVTFLFLGVLDAAAVAAAGVAFWPTRARRVRGAMFLAACLLPWAVVRLGFSLPLAPDLGAWLFPLAALLQALQMVAVIVVVLQGAKQRVEFLKEFNEKLIDGMGLGLALVGPDFTLRHTNRWMSERFGSELQGRTCLQTYLARPEQCEACPWQKPSLTSGQITVDGPGGRRFLITYSPLELPGGGQVLLELLSDITEQEAIRTRLLHSERFATMGQMASRVAHEVRNPLGIINFNLDLLQDELEPGGSREEALHSIRIMKAQVHGLARLVEAYLRFGRLPRPQLEAVDLEEVLETRLRALNEELELRKITLRRARAGPLPPLWADPAQLGQAFLNLFRNALEAMPAGGELLIRTRSADRRVEVEVADSGPGVPPADLERIFTPFYTTKDKGNGLGLTLARQIIQEHGGSLTCQNRPQGASFLATLPVGAATA